MGYTSWSLAAATRLPSSLKASCNSKQLPFIARLFVVLSTLKLKEYSCFCVLYVQLLAGRGTTFPGDLFHVVQSTPNTSIGYPGWKTFVPVLQPNVKLNLIVAPLDVIRFTTGGLPMPLPKPGKVGRAQPPLLVPLPL